jgi:cytochrome P450
MTRSPAFQGDVPSNVPREVIVDFDILNPPSGEDDIHLAWKQALQFGPEFVWTPHNGGHWICVRGAALNEIFKDYENFSSKEISLPKGQSPYPMAPTQSDRPEHTDFRSMLNPLLSPKAVGALEPQARELAVSLIDGLRTRGECEFVHDFAHIMPIVMFLRIMQLPLQDRELLMGLAHRLARPKDISDKKDAFSKIFAYMENVVNERRAHPGGDPISKFVHGTVNGRPIQHGEALGMCVNVLAGGLDTVAGLMGFTARFLAENPAHRRQLIAEPALIATSVDEFVRRFGVANVARIVPRDIIYRGFDFKEGDMILLASWMQGIDEACFERPLEIDFKRGAPIHTGFGNGIHRCPGSFLGRTELKVFLQEWLVRIPEFNIRPGDKPKSVPGQVFSMGYLPLVWNTN